MKLSCMGVVVPLERPLGLVLVTEAATLGSDLAAYTLGEAFLIGDDGLPKDPARARFWLKKAADERVQAQAPKRIR